MCDIEMLEWDLRETRIQLKAREKEVVKLKKIIENLKGKKKEVTI